MRFTRTAALALLLSLPATAGMAQCGGCAESSGDFASASSSFNGSVGSATTAFGAVSARSFAGSEAGMTSGFGGSFGEVSGSAYTTSWSRADYGSVSSVESAAPRAGPRSSLQDERAERAREAERAIDNMRTEFDQVFDDLHAEARGIRNDALLWFSYLCFALVLLMVSFLIWDMAPSMRKIRLPRLRSDAPHCGHCGGALSPAELLDTQCDNCGAPTSTQHVHS